MGLRDANDDEQHKNHSDTSAEAQETKGCDGKPNTHSCCSWKIIP